MHERIILSIDHVRFQHFDVLVGEKLANVVIGRSIGHVADKDFNRRFALSLALGYFDLDISAFQIGSIEFSNDGVAVVFDIDVYKGVVLDNLAFCNIAIAFKQRLQVVAADAPLLQISNKKLHHRE